MHGMQAWVGWPHEDEETAPGFAHHAVDALPGIVRTQGVGGLIAGSAVRVSNGVRTFSPCFYLHAELEQGRRWHCRRSRLNACYVVSADRLAMTACGIRQRSSCSRGRRAGGHAEEGPAAADAAGGANIGPQVNLVELVSSATGTDRASKSRLEVRAGFGVAPDDKREFPSVDG